MNLTRARGIHVLIGVSLTPWLHDVSVMGHSIKSRVLIFYLGPWRWETEFIRLIDDNGDI